MEAKSLKRAAELCAMELTVECVDCDPETIWVRTMTSVEVEEMAEALAAKRSEMREKYAEGQERRLQLRDELETYSLNQLAEFIIAFETMDIAQKARAQVPRLMAPQASKILDATKRAQAEEDYASRQLEWEQTVSDKAAELTERRRAELIAKPKPELIEDALTHSVRLAIGRDTAILQEEYTILYSVYENDRRTRYFETLEEIHALPAQVREALIQAIGEVDSVRPVDIKNSQGRSVLRIGPAESTPEPETSSTIASPVSNSPRRRSRGGAARSSTGSR